MRLLGKATDLLLYSSLWIGLCAAAQVWLTIYLLTGNAPDVADPYLWFVLSSTIVLYSIHRLVGISRVGKFNEQGRFAVIVQFRSHILVYGIIAAIAATFCFWHLPHHTMKALILPTIISLGYVLPILTEKKRLRDLPMIKIFLIAATWGALVTVVPIYREVPLDNAAMFAVFMERMLFIFAITLPFDIRDMEIDRISGVRTIVHMIGPQRTRWLAMSVMFISAILNVALIEWDVYPTTLYLPYLVFFGATLVLIRRSKPGIHDYYYSGLVDGTMILLPTLIFLTDKVLG